MENFHEKIERLLYLQNYFDMTKLLLAQNCGNSVIADYYKKSHKLFYRRFASSQGFMHIGLSKDGTYRKDAGYELYQLRFVQDAAADATDVLEIGCGQCANLGILAPLYPQINFYGIDLTPRTKDIHGLKNVRVYQDDYHTMSTIADQSIDSAFALETVCYSPHKTEVLNTVYKKLRKNGTFLLFDIFLDRPRECLNPIDEVYLSIMEHCYYLSPLDQYGMFIQQAQTCGFALCEDQNLSALAMPYLIEIEEREYRYLKAFGPLLRWLLPICPNAVSRSMPPGVMMRHMVEDGYLQYRFMQFRKAEL